MTEQLKGKIALITGGSSGIGRATAQVLSREGARVIIADINVEGSETTAKRITDAGGEAHFIKTDVSKSAEVAVLIDTIIGRYDRLDCACHSAAIMGDMVPVSDYDEETWNRVIDTNLKGTWLCMKHEIPHMLKQGSGSIVNTTSTSGVIGGGRHRCAYAASKGGIVSLTKGAASEYAEHGLRINAICPSHARTPMLEKFFELRPELEADFVSQLPMGRIAAPEEVAEASMWLCSDASSFVCGHVLTVDGGFSAR